METIKNFEQLIVYLRQRGDRKRIAVVWPEDSTTRAAVMTALKEGFIDAIMIGCRAIVEADKSFNPYMDHITIVDAADGDEAAAQGVAMVRAGNADVLMKGMLNTDNLLRAILNKEHGILKPGKVMTHITASYIPTYPRMLLFGDAAVIPYPTLEQRRAQIGYLAYVARALGVPVPKIALVHCTEKVDGRHFPVTEDYMTVIQEAKEGDFGECIVDGPMDVKTACSLKAMEKKHILSPINGEADALVMPDIEAGNTFYKTLTCFTDAITAGILQGTMAPVVLPSRGDSVESKVNSLALAAL